MEAVWKTKINRNWKVKVIEGDREVAGSSTSLIKRPIPAGARSYRRLTNTRQPACVWPRELAVIRVFVETLWVKPVLVLCIGFLCWWSLSRQTIPWRLFPLLPVSCLPAGFGLEHWRESGRQGKGRPLSISDPPYLGSVTVVGEYIPLLGPHSHWVFSSEWPHWWTTSFSPFVSQMGTATATWCSQTTYWPHSPPWFLSPWVLPVINSFNALLRMVCFVDGLWVSPGRGHSSEASGICRTEPFILTPTFGRELQIMRSWW